MSVFQTIPAGSLHINRWIDAPLADPASASAKPSHENADYLPGISSLSGNVTLPISPHGRWLLVALDAPLQLMRGDGTVSTQTLLRLQCVSVDSASTLKLALVDGPTRVFHLHVSDSTPLQLLARPLHGLMSLPGHAGQRWFVYLLAGHAQIQCGPETIRLQQGESVWINASGSQARLEGGGEIVLLTWAATPG